MAALSVIYSNFCGMVVSETRSGVESDYISDPLGSTIGLMGSTGTMTDRWEYWPYGEVLSRTGSNVTPLTFLGVIGYYLDVLAGLCYVRVRHFRNDIARWLTGDPMWPDQPSYAYAHNAPILDDDRSGFDPDGCSAKIVDSNLNANICKIVAGYLGYKCAGGTFCRLTSDFTASGSLTFVLSVPNHWIGQNNPCTAKITFNCKKHIDDAVDCPKPMQCLNKHSCRYDNNTGFKDPGPISNTLPGYGWPYTITNIRFVGSIHASTTAYSCAKPTSTTGGA